MSLYIDVTKRHNLVTLLFEAKHFAYIFVVSLIWVALKSFVLVTVTVLNGCMWFIFLRVVHWAFGAFWWVPQCLWNNHEKLSNIGDTNKATIQNSWGPFYQQGLTSIPALISKHIPSEVWYEITYPFPNFNGFTVGVWEWMSNFTPLFIMDLITYPRWN